MLREMEGWTLLPQRGMDEGCSVGGLSRLLLGRHTTRGTGRGQLFGAPARIPLLGSLVEDDSPTAVAAVTVVTASTAAAESTAAAASAEASPAVAAANSSTPPAEVDSANQDPGDRVASRFWGHWNDAPERGNIGLFSAIGECARRKARGP